VLDSQEKVHVCLICGTGKGKDIPVTGRGGPWGCEQLKLPHYLDKWLVDGGKVVSCMCRPHFTPRVSFFKIPGTRFC
jgi:hypothetical protein